MSFMVRLLDPFSLSLLPFVFSCQINASKINYIKRTDGRTNSAQIEPKELAPGLELTLLWSGMVK
jgi:hypothetical protein